MPFEMYGDVTLTRDVAEHGLPAGDVGTVVERHNCGRCCRKSRTVKGVQVAIAGAAEEADHLVDAETAIRVAVARQ